MTARGGLPEGLRWNYVSTNYDFVLEAILDNCLGNDDSYTLYTYRGVTPSSYCGGQPLTTVHDNWLVSNLLKINGGFEVFKDGAGFAFDYRNTRTDAQLRAEPPQLMLASREQDYTQQYFQRDVPEGRTTSTRDAVPRVGRLQPSGRRRLTPPHH